MDIGEPPVGDPTAMRSYAAALRADAEAVAARAAWLARRAERMNFEGPAASDFRQSMLDTRRAAERASAELRDIANHILSAAARVETDIADYNRYRESLESREGRAS